MQEEEKKKKLQQCVAAMKQQLVTTTKWTSVSGGPCTCHNDAQNAITAILFRSLLFLINVIALSCIGLSYNLKHWLFCFFLKIAISVIQLDLVLVISIFCAWTFNFNNLIQGCLYMSQGKSEKVRYRNVQLDFRKPVFVFFI